MKGCVVVMLISISCWQIFAVEIQPAPASIGADVPATYFGPPPSSVQRELIGPYQLLRSGTVDTDAGTVTIPMYRGTLEGDQNYSIWYVVTDSSDEQNAAALGINFSAKMRFSAVGRGSRTARLASDFSLVFNSGKVDFAPEHSVTPGTSPNYFPPAAVQPGSVGDSDYSPIVRIRNVEGTFWNAPIIAGNVTASQLGNYCANIIDATGRTFIHDKVVSICPSENGNGGTVTLSLTQGFSFGRPVFYLSLDASHDVPAAMEQATLAPGLQDLTVGGDDGLFSPVERIFAIINGYTNADINPTEASGPNEVNHPSRSGFNSALRGDGGALNVLGGIPTVATDYSPLWDLNVGEWTQYAVDNGYRARWLDEFQILGFVLNGFVTGPGGQPFGSTGFIVNCPIVHRFL